LDIAGTIYAITLTTANTAFLSKFLSAECKTAFEVPIDADYPMAAADSFKIVTPEGYTGTLEKGTVNRKLKVSSVYAAPAALGSHTVSAALTLVDPKLTIPIENSGSVIVTGVSAGFDKLSMGMKTITSVSGLTPGSHVIKNSLSNDQYSFFVTSGTDAVIFVRQRVTPWYERGLNKVKRSGIFLGLYTVFAGVMVLAVKTFDPEIYVLGGGLFGTLLGSNDGEESFLDENATDLVASDAGMEDLPTGRVSRSRSDQSTASSDIISSTTDSGQGEETFGGQDGSEEAHEKTDARSASLMVAVAAVASLFLLY